MGFGNVNAGGNRAPRIDDLVDILKLEDEFISIRLIGGVMPYAQHWIPIQTSKGEIKVPKVVPNFDPFTDSYDDTIKNPYKDIPGCQTQKHYYVNCIVRDLQEQEPRKKEKPSKEERKSGIIAKGSKTWNPVRVLRIPSGVAKQFQQLISMNKHKIKGKTMQCELSDPKYGCDIHILFNPEAAGAQKYMVQKGEHSPLTEKEQAYLMYDLDFTKSAMKPETEEKIKQEAKSLLSKIPEAEDFDDDDDDDDIDLSKSKSKKKKKKKSKSKDKKDKKKIRKKL